MTSLVDALRELEQRDVSLAAEIAELSSLEAEIAELRADAERRSLFLEQLPALRERAAAESREAEEEVTRRSGAVRAAEEALARSKRDDARVQAQRTLATTQTASVDAEARLARARKENERLEAEAKHGERDVPALEARAAELAQRAGGALEPGLDGVEHWGARARAAVFARRTHAESERASVLQDAAQIASSALGEPVVSGSVGAVRRRVEAANPG
jgi:hypothetical protein